MDEIRAVIFDLDGVIVTTDEYHYRAWKRLADAEGIPFDRRDNDRLRGVSRMQSLSIILEKSRRAYTDDEKARMAERKNNCYRGLLTGLKRSDILPGVLELLDALRKRGIRLAIGSSSRNAGTILKAIGLDNAFDAVVDGTHISRSKPDPEVFLLAAERLGVSPMACLVVEDADAGVYAALVAGMRVLAVGSASGHPGATLSAKDLTDISFETLLRT